MNEKLIEIYNFENALQLEVMNQYFAKNAHEKLST